jgi:hypothetical protein
MKMLISLLLCLVLLGVVARYVYADCGPIPYPPVPGPVDPYDPYQPYPDGLPRVPYNARYFKSVRISEPSQKAVIAWDGRQEVMVLTTELESTAPARVLEVMPLPARPKVEKGDAQLFEKAMEVVRKAHPELRELRGKLYGARPGGEVVEVKRIGPHEIHVVHVLDQGEFITWVEEYIRKTAKLPNPMIPETIKQSVREYLSEGYDWYVFDVIDVGKAKVNKDALMYTFESDNLFYPLKISRSASGDTKIELILITHDKLTQFLGHKRIEWKSPVPVSSGEMDRLSPQIGAMMGHRPVQFRYWVIKAPLGELSADLVCR